MSSRIIGLVAVLMLCGFLGILLWKVPRFDLGAVIVLTLILACYDFFVFTTRQQKS